MLILAGMAMLVGAVIALFPETDLSRSLCRWLIEAPARWLNRSNVWRILFYAGLIAGGFLTVLLFETEGLWVYRAMASEVVIWSMMFDVGLVIDALLVAAAVMASNGLRVARTRTAAMVHPVVFAIRRTVARARRVSVPRPRPIRKSDDDDRPAWAVQPPYRVFSMA